MVQESAKGDKMICYLYRHFDKNNCLLYVGISLSSISRLAQHQDASHWFAEIVSVKIETFANRQDALEAERAAIIKENPRHNLKRPSFKEVKAAEVKLADASRADLVRRMVQFNPMYSMVEAANVLCVSTTTIKKLLDAGEMGYVLINSKKRITGWQLIEFIEARAALSSTPDPTHVKSANYHGRPRSMVDAGNNSKPHQMGAFSENSTAQ
jgi:predicted GIY-YIG superfamily endonuclease